MQLPYFYEPFINTTVKQFSLSEESSKHVAQVLRMKEGEQLQLTDGKGLLISGAITNAHKKSTTVQINGAEHFPDSRQNICLAVAPTKNIGRIEWLLEKVTEIGVKKIILLKTKRTEKNNIKIARFQHIIISAMLQSRQVYLPELTGLTMFETVIKNNSYEEKYIAHCIDDKNKINLKTTGSTTGKIILIGPEGDFTEDEINLAIAENFKPVSLGQTRLRTETAGIVAAVLLSI